MSDRPTIRPSVNALLPIGYLLAWAPEWGDPPAGWEAEPTSIGSNRMIIIKMAHVEAEGPA